MEPPRAEPPLPPPVSPFNPAAPAPAKSGCSKPLILGCGGLFVLVGIVVVGLFIYAGTHVGQILQLSLRQSETAIFAQMPKDVSADEQQRLRSAFAAARLRTSHPMNPTEVAEASQQLQVKMLQVIRKGPGITRKDVEDLTDVLNEFAKTGDTPAAH
jgi:hypothetical protein